MKKSFLTTVFFKGWAALLTNRAVPAVSAGHRLFESRQHASALRLGDGLSIVLVSVLVGWVAKSAFGIAVATWSEFLLGLLFVAMTFVAVNELRGLYRPPALVSLASQLRGLTTNWSVICALLALATAVLHDVGGPYRALSIALYAGNLAALIAVRAALQYVRAAEPAINRRERVAVLQIGSTHVDSMVFRRSRVVHAKTVGMDEPVDFASFADSARALRAQKVILMIPADRLSDAPTFADRLRELPLPIYVVTEPWLVDIVSRPKLLDGNAPAFELRGAPLSVFDRLSKRSLDLLVAGMALVLLAPLMALVAIAVKLDSPGPVLFRQRRLGLNGREFRILKFRSMTVVEDGDKVTQAKRNDARITPFGRLIRSTSIDELPQLINVVRGEMSLVGPRPHAVAHDRMYEAQIADYSLRRRMKPGLTGWAQINGLRGETKSLDLMQRRVEHDLWYIESWTVWLDFKILFRTFKALFVNRDVY